MSEQENEPDEPKVKLTKRMLQVLPLIEQGCTNQEIGLRLGTSHHTVKVQLFRMFKVLGVKNRTTAVSVWRKHICPITPEKPANLLVNDLILSQLTRPEVTPQNVGKSVKMMLGKQTRDRILDSVNSVNSCFRHSEDSALSRTQLRLLNIVRRANRNILPNLLRLDPMDIRQIIAGSGGFDYPSQSSAIVVSLDNLVVPQNGDYGRLASELIFAYCTPKPRPNDQKSDLAIAHFQRFREVAHTISTLSRYIALRFDDVYSSDLEMASHPSTNRSSQALGAH